MRKKNHDTANGEYQYARPKTSVPMLGLGMARSKSNPSLMRVNEVERFGHSGWIQYIRAKKIRLCSTQKDERSRSLSWCLVKKRYGSPDHV